MRSFTGIPPATHREMNVARNACAVNRSIFTFFSFKMLLHILSMSSLISDEMRRPPPLVVNTGAPISTTCAAISERIDPTVFETAGAEMDRKGRPVVSETMETTVPHLYAAGLNAGGWIGPYYPGSGTAIIGTVHWGRKAGAKAAAN